MVRPPGIEPGSEVPQTSILSIKLRALISICAVIIPYGIIAETCLPKSSQAFFSQDSSILLILSFRSIRDEFTWQATPPLLSDSRKFWRWCIHRIFRPVLAEGRTPEMTRTILYTKAWNFFRKKWKENARNFDRGFKPSLYAQAGSENRTSRPKSKPQKTLASRNLPCGMRGIITMVCYLKTVYCLPFY